jgi:hypothetical protein
MKTRNAVIDVNPIVVNVSVVDQHIIVSPNIPIPWDFQGTVQWHIATEGAQFDANAGVKFAAEKAPFHPYPVSPTVWAMDASNTDPSTVLIRFKYTLKLTDGNVTIIDDPTVENDSPPKPAARRVRRTRRIARTGRIARTRV